MLPDMKLSVMKAVGMTEKPMAAALRGPSTSVIRPAIGVQTMPSRPIAPTSANCDLLQPNSAISAGPNRFII